MGIEPVVLTVKDGTFQSIDESLLEDVPANLKVTKTKSFEVFKIINSLSGGKKNQPSVGMIGLEKGGLLNKIKLYVRANYFIPDMRKGWNKYALKAAEEIIEREKIDAIYSTGPPHSSHLIALALKKKYSLPWITDLRDPWVNIYYNKVFPRTNSTIAKDQKLEDSVIKTTDHIITVSEGLKQEFAGRNENISVIYNGYDEDDFVRNSKEKSTRFVISYIGNFKPNQQVSELWEALSELATENADFGKDLQIQLVGNVDSNIIRSIKDSRLENNLHQLPFQAHKRAVELMMNSSVLLFIIPKTTGNHLILTGKLFEYLATGTPLLSIGPVDGNASAIISECEHAPMMDYTDKAAIKKEINRLYNNWKTDSEEVILNEQVKTYSRKGQTEKLAKIIQSL